MPGMFPKRSVSWRFAARLCQSINRGGGVAHPSGVASGAVEERTVSHALIGVLSPAEVFHSSLLSSLRASTASFSSSPVYRNAGSGGTVLADAEQDVPSIERASSSPAEEEEGASLTPAKVVEMLDRYIVGQAEAKRAVAVALRNRWRRHKIPSPQREEIVPKNILMIGPTGCGKTEIARRLAKLADAPFVKVEATKFTEVGFHGRDVDQIIRDLVDAAIALQRLKIRTKVLKEVEGVVENKILDIFVGTQPPAASEEAQTIGSATTRERFRTLYREGKMDERRIDVDIPDSRIRVPVDITGPGIALSEIIVKMDKVSKGGKGETRKMTVTEARNILTEMEMEKHMGSEQITKEAITLAESDGIVFIDEIDKIVTSSETRHGVDASSEGVQRDLLPIIEGSTVSTKYGNVNTDHILFICSGSFHACKPSDMLAELQGRLPIRVELKGLTRQDLFRILTEPEMNMIKQQKMLMATENVELVFTNDAIQELALVAAEVNKSLDNIGARRLHTVLERVVEDISFNAPDLHGQTITINKEDVRSAVGNLLKRMDLSKFVL